MIGGELTSFLIPAMVFLATCGVLVVGYLLTSGRGQRVDERLRELSKKPDRRAPETSVKQLRRTSLPSLAAPLIPSQDAERTRLQARLIHAGFYTGAHRVFPSMPVT